jgi:DNA-binding transcriptional regulator PaaX
LNDSTLTMLKLMSEDMRRHNASEQSILKEIAEKTGLNYKTLRMTVSRMHEAGLIAWPFRGKYTTLEQDAESKKRMEEERKARELEKEAFKNVLHMIQLLQLMQKQRIHPKNPLIKLIL